MNFRTRIESLFYKNSIGIWFMWDKENSTGFQTSVAKPMTLVFEEQKEEFFSLPEPSLELDARMAIPFLKSILMAIEENKYISTKIEENSKECSALKENLKDLRDISSRLFNLLEKK